MNNVRLKADSLRVMLDAVERTGGYVKFVVKVDWPEFQLSEEQVLANSAALAFGRADPHPDPSLIGIVIEPGHTTNPQVTRQSLDGVPKPCYPRTTLM